MVIHTADAITIFFNKSTFRLLTENISKMNENHINHMLSISLTICVCTCVCMYVCAWTDSILLYLLCTANPYKVLYGSEYLCLIEEYYDCLKNQQNNLKKKN